MQTVVVDGFEGLQTVFDGITAQAQSIDWTDELKSELDYIAELEKGYFDSSTGPDGAPWKANAPSTIKQKGHAVVLRGIRGQIQKSHKATKRRPSVRSPRARNITGFRLATSLTTKTTQSFGDSIREVVPQQSGAALHFGTTVPYSTVNQEGNDRIPARPHLGLTNQYLDQATNRVADFAIKQLSK